MKPTVAPIAIPRSPEDITSIAASYIYARYTENLDAPRALKMAISFCCSWMLACIAAIKEKKQMNMAMLVTEPNM